MRVHDPKNEAVSDSVYEASDELALQEEAKQEAKRIEQEKRIAIAAAAKEELEKLTKSGGARVLPNPFTQF